MLVVMGAHHPSRVRVANPYFANSRDHREASFTDRGCASVSANFLAEVHVQKRRGSTNSAHLIYLLRLALLVPHPFSSASYGIISYQQLTSFVGSSTP